MSIFHQNSRLAHLLLHGATPPMTPILDSRKLLAFTTLARTTSFTRAAQELLITQSAVSHAIKSLEQELGCRLFDRLGRGVRLTPAGNQLLDRAQKIISEMETARADLRGLPEEMRHASSQ